MHFSFGLLSPLRVAHRIGVLFRALIPSFGVEELIMQTPDITLSLQGPHVNVNVLGQSLNITILPTMAFDVEWQFIEIDMSASPVQVIVNRNLVWPIPQPDSVARRPLTEVWLGCSSATTGLSSSAQNSFTGCVKQLYIGDMEVISARKSTQLADFDATVTETGTLQGNCSIATDPTRPRDSVQFHSTSPSAATLEGSSLRVAQPWKEEVAFWFRTREADTFLAASLSGGQFALYISCGYLKLEYSIPGIAKTSILHHPDTVDDNQWHRVHLRRRPSCQLQLTVDSKLTRTLHLLRNVTDDCAMSQWNEITLGGFQTDAPSWLPALPGLQGCVATFSFERLSTMKSDLLNLLNMKPSKGVQPSCSALPTYCSASSCKNGGKCIDRSHSFECDCSETDYAGKYCDKAPLTATIAKRNVWVYMKLPLRCEERCAKHDVLSFEFRARLLSGVLFHGSLGQNISISLVLENNHVFLQIDGAVHLSEKLLTKNAWYKVQLAIRRHVVDFSVDGQSMIVSLPAVYTSQTYCLAKEFTIGGALSPRFSMKFFTGCVSRVLLNGKDLFEEEKFSENSMAVSFSRNGCIEPILDCDDATQTDYVEYTIPYVSAEQDLRAAGSAFMYMLPNNSHKINFGFSTEEPYGILAAIHGTKDTLFLLLNDSRLCMTISQSLTSAIADTNCIDAHLVSHNQQHQVFLLLQDNDIMLLFRPGNIAQCSECKISKSISAKQFFGRTVNLGYSHCPGVHTNVEDMQNKLHRPFAGCLTNVRIGEQCFIEPIKNTICSRPHTLSNRALLGCRKKFCQNSSVCHHQTECQNHLAGYKCKCQGSGYAGEKCESSTSSMTFSGEHLNFDIAERHPLNNIFLRLKVPGWLKIAAASNPVAILTAILKNKQSGIWLHLIEDLQKIRVTIQYGSVLPQYIDIVRDMADSQYHTIEMRVIHNQAVIIVDNTTQSSIALSDTLQFDSVTVGHKPWLVVRNAPHPSVGFYGWVKELYINQWRPLDLHANLTHLDHYVHKTENLDVNTSARIGEYPLDCPMNEVICVLPTTDTPTTDTPTTAPTTTPTTTTPALTTPLVTATTDCSPNDVECVFQRTTEPPTEPCEPNEPCEPTPSANPSEGSSSGRLGGGAIAGILLAVLIGLVPLVLIAVLIVAKYNKRDSGEYKMPARNGVKTQNIRPDLAV